MLEFIFALVAATSLDSTKCSGVHAAIEKVRANDTDKPNLLAHYAKEYQRDDVVAKACAAAVLSEESLARSDLARTEIYLRDVQKAFPSIASTIDGHRALLLIESNQRDAAQNISLTDAVSADMRQQIAVGLAQSDDDKRKLLQTQQTLAARKQLCAMAREKKSAVRASCEPLLLSHPRDDAARAIEEEFIDGFSLKGIAERAQALTSRARAKRAVVELLQWQKSHPTEFEGPNATRTEVDIFFDKLATAYVRATRLDDALKLTRENLVVTRSLQRLKTHAWVLAKAQKLEEASAIYDEISRIATEAEDISDANFSHAFNLYEAAKYDEAVTAFQSRYDTMKGTDNDVQARWYTALCQMLLNRFDDAEHTLTELSVTASGDKEALKFRYWLARSLEVQGKTADAQKMFVSIATTDPIEYYAQLARRRTKLARIKGTLVAADALRMRRPTGPNVDDALLLYELGFEGDALRLVTPSSKDKGGYTLDVIGLMHAFGEYHLPWRRGGAFIPFPRVKNQQLVKSQAWRVSYAEPYFDVVTQAARDARISTHFLYAIMRTESGFKADAVSVAGAQGIIQLMPAAARGVAVLSGRKAEYAEHMHDADVAIVLGAFLLGRGLEEYKSIALAAAVYNGGAPNVNRWISRFSHLEPELFIERVPFKETRDYIKRITAVEATYRALDGEPLEIQLPATIMKEPPAVFTHFDMDE